MSSVTIRVGEIFAMFFASLTGFINNGEYEVIAFATFFGVATKTRSTPDLCAAKLERAGWDVYRLPQGFRWTFTNCLIFNRKVIAGYVNTPMTLLEKEPMKELYPSKTIVPIEIGPMVRSGGGVHCVTQQQPR